MKKYINALSIVVVVVLSAMLLPKYVNAEDWKKVAVNKNGTYYIDQDTLTQKDKNHVEFWLKVKFTKAGSAISNNASYRKVKYIAGCASDFKSMGFYGIYNYDRNGKMFYGHTNPNGTITYFPVKEESLESIIYKVACSANH